MSDPAGRYEGRAGERSRTDIRANARWGLASGLATVALISLLRLLVPEAGVAAPIAAAVVVVAVLAGARLLLRRRRTGSA